MGIALDPATSELARDGAYVLEHEGRTLSAAELAAYWEDVAARYPILSIEDGMDEEDWDGWKALTDRIGDRVQLVGDDLFVTNTERLRRGIDSGVANSILVKVNQIGTLTETLDAVRTATEAGYTVGDVAPLGRDRGHHDRRPRRGHRLRADQDGCSLALGSGGEVQPAPAHRGGAGGGRHLSRPVGIPVARSTWPAGGIRRRPPKGLREWPHTQPRARPRRSGGIRWDRVGRIALLTTLVVIVGLYVSPARHWIEQSRTAGEQTRELQSLTDENHALKRRVNALRDPRSLEREARRLGMVRQGERPYVVQGLPR